MAERSVTLPATPVIPANVASGDLITAAHENTVIAALNDLWTNEEYLAGVSGNVAAALGIVIDGGGAVPSTGSKGFLQVPYACTITGWTILANAAGSASITVKKCAYSAFPATTSIVASAPPSLISAQNNMSTALTGWTTAIAAGDVLEFNLDSVATIQRLTLELQVNKT